MKRAENSPMRRWEEASVKEEPWNIVSGVFVEDLERGYGVDGRNNDLILKDDSCVRVEPTATSNGASSKLEDRPNSGCKLGDSAGLVGIGTWSE
jgi:hypothetical protein